MQFEKKQALAHKRRPVSHRVDVLPNRLVVHPGFRMGMRLFGPFEVEWRGHRLGPRDFGGTKPRQILQTLAIECGHPVPKLRLAERLWGESPPRNVAAPLETYVCVLRRHLSPGDDAGHGLVVTERGAYRLATEGVDLDIDRFDELIRAASRREGIDSRLSCLEEALDLALRGELLPEEPYAAWAEGPREWYQRRTVFALLDAAHAAAAQGDFARALTHAEGALFRDELSERAWRAVMVALYGLGCEGEALRVYERCAARLRQWLGVPPLPSTDAVRAAIVNRSQARSLVGLLGSVEE